MKWSTLLSKVVFAAGQHQEQPPAPPPPPPGSPLHRPGQQADLDLSTPRVSSASAGGDDGGFDAAAGSSPSAAASLSRWAPSPSQVKRPFNGPVLPESNPVMHSQLGCDPVARSLRVEQWRSDLDSGNV